MLITGLTQQGQRLAVHLGGGPVADVTLLCGSERDEGVRLTGPVACSTGTGERSWSVRGTETD